MSKSWSRKVLLSSFEIAKQVVSLYFVKYVYSFKTLKINNVTENFFYTKLE